MQRLRPCRCPYTEIHLRFFWIFPNFAAQCETHWAPLPFSSESNSPAFFSLRVVPRVVGSKDGQNDRSSITRPRGSRRRRALGVYKRDAARPHARHLGLCGRRGGEIRRPRAQTGEPPGSVPVTSQCCAQEGAGQALRVHHGLLVANIVEDVLTCSS